MPRNFDLESFNPHGISVYVDQSGERTYLHSKKKKKSQQGALKCVLYYKLTK